MPLSIVRADYHDPRHAADLVNLLDAYASDPMGGDHPLAPEARARLIPALAAMPHARSWLAYIDGAPAGLLNAFVGLSTFAARPLLNLHDISVLPHFRGCGVGRALMTAAEEHARSLGCCKLTLEVLVHNQVACSAYKSFGFAAYELDQSLGEARFWEKLL